MWSQYRQILSCLGLPNWNFPTANINWSSNPLANISTSLSCFKYVNGRLRLVCEKERGYLLGKRFTDF